MAKTHEWYMLGATHFVCRNCRATAGTVEDTGRMDKTKPCVWPAPVQRYQYFMIAYIPIPKAVADRLPSKLVVRKVV